MAKILGFHHTAIRTADFDQSVQFYTEVLGLQVKVTWGEGDQFTKGQVNNHLAGDLSYGTFNL